MAAQPLPVVVLTGPTAVGKSDVALALAARIPCELISVDSAQVYRGMDLGTAKPDVAERAAVPHHLLDLRDPEQRYSAGDFQRDALAAIAGIRERGRVPLLVGGTMLYLDALLHGLSELPVADPELRAAIDAEARVRGWPALHAELAAVDPQAAARIGPNDRQRIQRALEVLRLTGAPLSAAQDATRPALSGAACFALLPAERAQLHQRIEHRFMRMLEAGLLDEVRELHGREGLTGEHPSMRAVGYRQLWAHLDGDCDLATATARGIAATRQLAKRQLTWLNRFPEAGRILRGEASAEELAGLILHILGPDCV